MRHNITEANNHGAKQMILCSVHKWYAANKLVQRTSAVKRGSKLSWKSGHAALEDRVRERERRMAVSPCSQNVPGPATLGRSP